MVGATESTHRTLCVDFPGDSAKARTELLALSLIGIARNPSETVGDGDLPRLNLQPRRGKSFDRSVRADARFAWIYPPQSAVFKHFSPLRTFAGVGVRGFSYGIGPLHRHHSW